MEQTKMTKEEFKNFSLCSKCRHCGRDRYIRPELRQTVNDCRYYDITFINWLRICYDKNGIPKVHKCYLFEEKK